MALESLKVNLALTVTEIHIRFTLRAFVIVQSTLDCITRAPVRGACVAISGIPGLRFLGFLGCDFWDSGVLGCLVAFSGWAFGNVN